ncbi:MAG: MATE family efflux transporter [Oscillospiraceae bacterium]|nr:MATE family efflux transporter [Oscillospiraceae bacterium]
MKTRSTIDFTEGRPLPLIMQFYFPLLMTSTLQQLYNFADTAIVGNGLGDNSLAAVGNMSSLCFLIMGFSMGLSNGFSIMIAQAYGEKNMPRLRRSYAAVIKLAVMLAVILTLFSVVLLRPILTLMRTPDLIIGESLTYGYIIFGGISATIAYNMSSGILRALGDSKTPLFAIIASSILNVFLNCVFIFGLRTGVGGAAIATVVSQLISGGICIRRLAGIDFLRLGKEDMKDTSSMYGTLLKNGIPVAFMNSITAVGCMVVQYFVNGLGVAYTSAYSACSKYLNMFMMPAATAGNTMSAYTSQNYGAKRFDRIKQGLKICLGIAGVSYVILGSVMRFMPVRLADILLTGDEQIALAAQFMPICGLMLFAVDALFVIRNAVQGMGFPMIPMFSGIAEMVLRIGTIVMFVGSIGFTATAYAEVCAWVGALLINTLAFIFIFARESSTGKYALSHEHAGERG